MRGIKMRKLRSSGIRSFLSVVATLSVIAASGSVIWLVWSIRVTPASDVRRIAQGAPTPRVPPRLALPASPLSLEDGAIKGERAAAVGIVVYSDFQCPYCERFARETLPRLDREYLKTGKAFLVFRHLPLERLHPAAFRAAAVAECGRRQGRFWEVHDTLFARARDLPAATLDLAAFATANGLRAAELERCVNKEGQAAVARDESNSQALGITSTPTFLFGIVNERGALRVIRRETGAMPYLAFVKILDDVLAAGVSGN
jgi:protein-disulfide isomerase